MKGKLTAIAHYHDFGIDTVLVPGPPVRIHARISGHGSDLRGKEGTRKRSAGTRGEGGLKEGRGGGGGEERRRRGKGSRGEEERERLARRNQAKGAAKTRSITWDARFVAPLPLYRSSLLSFCGTAYRLSSALSFRLLQLLDFPIWAKNFHG